MVVPGATLAALVFTFGIYAIIDGVILIAAAFAESRGRAAYIVRGLLGLVAGVFTFVSPGLTAVSLYILIGAWAVVLGVTELTAAVMLRKDIAGVGGLILTGVLTLAFGVVLFALPPIGITALIGLVIGYAIANGIMLIGVGNRIHKLVKAAPALAAA